MQTKKFLVFKTTEKEKIDTGREFIRVSPLLDVLKTRTDLKALDLGCRLPEFLWLCYHIYSCKKIVGIELNSEEEVIREQLRIIRRDNPTYYDEYFPLKSLHEWYLHAVKPDIDEPPLIQSKSKYDSTFEIHFDTNMRDFLREATEQFDVINASNVLHFFVNQNEMEEMLRHIQRLLTPNGFVFIRVQNAGRSYFDYRRFKKILRKLFRVGVLTEYQEFGKWEIATFRNFGNTATLLQK